MFRGEWPLSLDAKGRLAIPARFRERLADACGGSLVVTRSPTRRCLAIYPFPEWKQIEDKVQALPAQDKGAERLRYILLASAFEVEADGQGRILLPATLREWAGLDRQVYLVGLVKKFEVWEAESWKRFYEGLYEADEKSLGEPSEAVLSLVL